jgi:hypothetical protein
MSLADKVILNRANDIGVIGHASKPKTSSSLICTGPCLILGIKIKTNKVADVVLNIYDNTSASGDVWDDWFIIGPDGTGGGFYPAPMYMENGIYIDVTAGSAYTYNVFFAKLKV